MSGNKKEGVDMTKTLKGIKRHLTGRWRGIEVNNKAGESRWKESIKAWVKIS